MTTMTKYTWRREKRKKSLGYPQKKKKKKKKKSYLEMWKTFKRNVHFKTIATELFHGKTFNILNFSLIIRILPNKKKKNFLIKNVYII